MTPEKAQELKVYLQGIAAILVRGNPTRRIKHLRSN